jgi:hypothetical protein
MTYMTTYPPSGAHAFNAAWTVLHTLQEHIRVLHKWPQDIPRSPHVLDARSWLIARRTRIPYRMIGTVLKETSSWGTGPGFTTPSGRILTFLPCPWCVVTESKPLLACHLLRLLQSLYGHLSVSSPRFSKIGPYTIYYICNSSDTICGVLPLSKDGQS